MPMITGEDKSLLEAFLAIIGGCFAVGLWIRRKENAPQMWQKASGVIVTSKTVDRNLGNGRHNVVPVIEYEFSHGGQSSRSSHWRFGNFSVGNTASAEPSYRATRLARQSPSLSIHGNRRSRSWNISFRYIGFRSGLLFSF